MKSGLSICGSAYAKTAALSGFAPRLLIVLAMLALSGLSAEARARGPKLPFNSTNTVTMAQGTTTNVFFTVEDDAVGWSGIQTTTASFLTNGAFPDSILVVSNLASLDGPPPGWTNKFSYETNTLTITPGQYKYGTNVMVLISTDIWGDSSTNRLLLNVYHVSQPPSFAFKTNLVVVLEESGVQTNSQFVRAITNGAGNPPGLTWKFSTTYAQTTNGVKFKTPPAITNYNGTIGLTADLTFAPTNNSFGSNLVTVVMTDSGANVNGGRTAFTNSFWLVVAAIVHPPVISWATNRAMLENGIALTNVVIRVSGDSPGSALALTAVSMNTNIASVSVTSTNVIGAPSTTTNSQFTLALTPLLNAYGTVTNQLIASEVVGSDTFFSTNYLVLTVTHVTQAPSFSLATNELVVLEESGPQTIVNFARNIGSGAGNPVGTLAQFKFNVTTVTNTAANAQFTVLPSLAVTNGILTFTPKAHSFGTNLVTVTITNILGSTTSGGVITFTTNFLLKVTQISHAPTIVQVPTQTMLENRAATNIVVNVWNYDVGSNNLALTAVSQNTNIALVTVTATNVMSPTNTQFTLRLSPVTNAYGTNTIQLTASALVGTTNTSSINVPLTLTHVSQAPSFVLATNTVVVSEQATAVAVTTPNFLRTITNGAGNLPGTNWAFTVTAANKALFGTTNQPAISHDGTLTFTPVRLTNGTTAVSVIMRNTVLGESTTNGGVITFTNTFALTISHVTLTPSFALATSTLVVPEHAGLVTSNNFLTGITAGLGNPAGMTWTFTVSSATNGLGNVTFAQFPSVATNGTLSFAASDYSFGTNTVTVVMSIINGGLITFTNSFTLQVPWINQTPSFGLSANSITVDKYNVPVTISGAANNILAGPPNETNSQTVSILVNNDNSSLFTTQPAIDANGTLTFTPGNQPGFATLQIRAHDTGGTANSGIDTSTNQTLTVVIPTNTFENATGTFAGVFFGTNTVALASSGYFSLALDTNGAFTGYLLCGNDSNSFSGQFGVSNYTTSVTAANYTLNLSVDTASQMITGSVTNTVANWRSSLRSYLSGYGNDLDATYLAAMPGFINAKVGTLGDSVFHIAISSGVASLTGNMADSNQVSQASPLCTNGYLPVYIPLYTNANGANGLLIGWINFNDADFDSVTADSTLIWISATNATALYPKGFTNNVAPLISTYYSTQPQLLPINKGYVQMSGGGLTIPVIEAVTVVNNQILVNTPTGDGLNLTMNSSSGEIQGSFVDGNGDTNQIESIILQNDSVARGYFQGIGQSGSFILVDSAGQLYEPPFPAFTGVTPHTGITATGVIASGITNLTFSENAGTNDLRLSFALYDPLTNSFTVTSSSANTSVAAVSLTGTGTHRDLWFAPVTNQFGSNITVTLTADDGTLTNSYIINLTVALVNHAPSFTLATNAYTVGKFGVAVSVPNAITNIISGPASESSQTVAFNVANDRNDLFSVQPSVDSNGTLSYTPNQVGGGTVTVQIAAQDNGGANNGGVDTSAIQTITITIPTNPFTSLVSGGSSTGTFIGLFSDTNAVTPAMESSGYFSLTLANDGSFNGYLVCAGATNLFAGQFSVSPFNATVTLANYALSLTLDPNAATVTGSVTSTSPGWSAALQSYLTAAPTLAGNYLVAMPGIADPSAGPAGDSVFSVTIDTNGVATLAGHMADNTAVSLVSQLSAGGNCPIYTPLYTNGVSGLLIGWLNFTNDAANNAAASSTLTWFNAAGATPALYPAGFTNQAVPVASIYDASAPDQLTHISHYAILTGGSFGANLVTNVVTIVNNSITVDPSATNGLSLTINAVSGEIQGSFVDNGVTNYIESVMLQDTNIARGFFTSASGDQSGSFVLADNYQVPSGPYPIVFTGITNVTMLENASTLVMPFSIFDPLTTNIASVQCTPVSANVTVSVNPNGTTLSITPAANFSGAPINFTVTAVDGNTKSNSFTFSVTVSWVNQVPSFSRTSGLVSGITVDKFNAAVTVLNAVTNISPGLGNNVLESGQTVGFILTNDSPSLFAIGGQPAIDASGTLTFTPGKQGGTVIVQVQAQDSGGVANNGVDTSTSQLFTIIIPANTFTAVTDPSTGSGTFVGLLYDTNGVTPDSSGYFTLTLTNDGTFNVSLVCVDATNSVNGQFSTSLHTNVAVANYILDLTLDTAVGTVIGSVTNTVAHWNAELQSYLAGNSIITAGSYNLTTAGFDDITEGPTGDNIFNVAISTNGVATLGGYLADDTSVSQVSPLSAAGYCPIYIPLYGNGTNGVLIGWLNFTNDALNENVVPNSALTWINKSGATPNLYPTGFTNVAGVQGSSYRTDSSYTNNLLGSSSSNGIGYILLSGGNLGANPVVTKVGITNNVITVISPQTRLISLNIVPNTGMVQGQYVDPKGLTNNIQGAIFQNNAVATGYFMGVNTNQSGLFMLFGN